MNIFNLNNEQFNLVLKGIKTVDGRINHQKFLYIKPNDIVVFENEDKNTKVKIIRRTEYRNIISLVENEHQFLGLIKNEAIELYEDIYNTFDDRNDIRHHGMVAFEFEIIK